MGDAVFYDDDDLVPVLRFVGLEFFVGAGDEVIAALELRLADEDAAVCVDGGAKFEAELEVGGEELGGVKLAEVRATFFIEGVHDEHPVLGGVATV